MVCTCTQVTVAIAVVVIMSPKMGGKNITEKLVIAFEYERYGLFVVRHSFDANRKTR